MRKYARLNALLELLAERGELNVDEAAAELSVSPATIRRDLDTLAEQQLLTRTHGGAVPNATAYDLPLRYKSVRKAEEKQRIGRAAAALVSPGAIVGSNGGTTTTEVARAIATRADLQEGAHDGTGGQSITFVTNALNIANELTVRPHIKVVVTGGVARTQSYELIGPLAEHILDNLSLDIVFLGVDGLDVSHGASAHHEGESRINTLMASRARQVVIVADASKLGRHAFSRICPIEDVDVLVTDRSAPKDLLDRFTAAGLKVIRA
ncbi:MULTISPECIES: DeoR/GlpR family DNA-binding transcription regulator [Thermocrispum]|jgi:DeoR family transcriptional regulator of aga operon|uniref:DeoR/GlpR family DNA-binding transcription regulator n=1 Tax=Thermocrispum agreste TaxID=37925 RepID=A0A2W4JP93_9PSEU|nr:MULTISPECIES: DeoR/GlpR family DNA-binding transcription regulator [Thermocrispum]PZM99565.1 MAG: DeoR/GlpR transcriptional regulator [Thermocrispum agreste]